MEKGYPSHLAAEQKYNASGKQTYAPQKSLFVAAKGVERMKQLEMNNNKSAPSQSKGQQITSETGQKEVTCNAGEENGEVKRIRWSSVKDSWQFRMNDIVKMDLSPSTVQPRDEEQTMRAMRTTSLEEQMTDRRRQMERKRLNEKRVEYSCSRMNEESMGQCEVNSLHSTQRPHEVIPKRRRLLEAYPFLSSTKLQDNTVTPTKCFSRDITSGMPRNAPVNNTNGPLFIQPSAKKVKAEPLSEDDMEMERRKENEIARNATLEKNTVHVERPTTYKPCALDAPVLRQSQTVRIIANRPINVPGPNQINVLKADRCSRDFEKHLMDRNRDLEYRLNCKKLEVDGLKTLIMDIQRQQNRYIDDGERTQRKIRQIESHSKSIYVTLNDTRRQLDTVEIMWKEEKRMREKIEERQWIQPCIVRPTLHMVPPLTNRMTSSSSSTQFRRALHLKTTLMGLIGSDSKTEEEVAEDVSPFIRFLFHNNPDGGIAKGVKKGMEQLKETSGESGGNEDWMMGILEEAVEKELINGEMSVIEQANKDSHMECTVEFVARGGGHLKEELNENIITMEKMQGLMKNENIQVNEVEGDEEDSELEVEENDVRKQLQFFKNYRRRCVNNGKTKKEAEKKVKTIVRVENEESLEWIGPYEGSRWERLRRRNRKLSKKMMEAMKAVEKEVEEEEEEDEEEVGEKDIENEESMEEKKEDVNIEDIE